MFFKTDEVFKSVDFKLLALLFLDSISFND